MADLIQIRRGTEADWTAIDPILAQGEFAVTLDNLGSDPKFKIGDGLKKWSELPYIGVAGETPGHNELEGLQGGTDNEYYHLTENEATSLATLLAFLTGTAKQTLRYDTDGNLEAISNVNVDYTDNVTYHNIEHPGTLNRIETVITSTDQLSVVKQLDGIGFNTETIAALSTLLTLTRATGNQLVIRVGESYEANGSLMYFKDADDIIRFKIYMSGAILSKYLAGTGNRPLLADENGNVKPGSADILTNSHTHTNKTFLDGLLEFGTDAGDVAEGNHGHNHNDLNSLQGGTAGEYYHLTQTELTDLGTAISDSHTHTNKTLLDSIVDSGDGNEFLSDDGTYKAAGLSYFEESRSVAKPNATVPAHQIIPKGEETNIDVVISPKGTGSILAQIPNGNVAGGIKRGSNCIDLQLERTGGSQVPSAPSSVIIGGKDSKISGTAGYNVILCASGATISTTGAYTSWYNSIIGGNDNEIKYGGCNIILGGESNSIIDSSGSTSMWSGIIGGQDNIITFSQSSVIAGGESNEMYNSGCSFIGGSNYAKTTQRGQHAHATNRFAATGDAQRSVRMFMGNTLETNYYRLKTAAKNVDLKLNEFVMGKYSTWFCKLKISGVRRTTGAIDHYCSEHNFMLMKENSIPFLYDFDPPNGLYVNEIMSSQQNGSSVGLALSVFNLYYLAIDMATTETGWQFVAHLETVETFASSLI